MTARIDALAAAPSIPGEGRAARRLRAAYKAKAANMCARSLKWPVLAK